MFLFFLKASERLKLGLRFSFTFLSNTNSDVGFVCLW